MSISITINNINTLSDTERAVLRLIAGEMITATVADTLKGAVRDIAAQPAQDEDDAAAPVEPTEAHSPHTQVIDLPQAPTPANPNLDANGLPWDKRIHSSSRAKVADGTWRYARNLDKALIATVEAELRAVQAIPVPEPVAPVATTPAGWPFRANDTSVPVVSADGNELVRQVAAECITTPPAPIVPLPPVAPPAPTTLPMTFAQLMQHVTPLLVSGKLTQPILQGVVEKCGLPHLAALGARPDLVETVRAAIDEAVGGVQ